LSTEQKICCFLREAEGGKTLFYLLISRLQEAHRVTVQVRAHTVRSILLPIFQDPRSKREFPWRSKISQGQIRGFAFYLALANGKETSEISIR